MMKSSPARGRTAESARVLALLGALLLPALVAPGAGYAQAPTDRNAIRLDISYLAAAASYARRTGDAWFVGGGTGLGIEIVQAAVTPVRLPAPDIRHAEIIHIAAFASWTPSHAFRTDMGMRLALMYYGRENVSSAGFAGPYIAPAFGYRRVKLSSRAQLGYVYAIPNSGVGLFIQPVVLSIVFPW